MEKNTGKNIFQKLSEGVRDAFLTEITVAQEMGNVLNSHLGRDEAVELVANVSAPAFLKPDAWDSVV